MEVVETRPLAFEEEYYGDTEPEAGRSRWSTAFLMAGSALMGATALALWNRRTITSMRAQIEAMSAVRELPAAAVLTVEEEIF